MGVETKIQWCDHTFNPWRGCTKVSPGCANCYAEKLSRRNHAVLGTWGDGGTRVVASEATWREPLKWNDSAERDGVRRRVFCASLADVFEDWRGRISDTRGLAGHRFYQDKSWGFGPDSPSDLWNERTENAAALELNDLRDRLFRVIEQTTEIDWLLLTKRPENIIRMTPRWSSGFPDNVWIGTSVENQEQADKRIPLLLEVPAKVRFLSAEPLLGPLDLTRIPVGIGWVIVGAESGGSRREMNLSWACDILRQCRRSGVAFFLKQIVLNGKINGEIDCFPRDLQVRAFPSVEGEK